MQLVSYFLKYNINLLEFLNSLPVWRIEQLLLSIRIEYKLSLIKNIFECSYD